MAYGKELILDLYNINPEKVNRESIEQWLDKLCELINMKQEDLHFWDYEGCPEEEAKAPIHLVGTSAIQFISTSDIVIHALKLAKECYINLFTCKEFCVGDAVKFTIDWFETNDYDMHVLQRGKRTKCN